MATTAGNVIDVTQAIQLSLSPVFLLTGVTGMLGVMTGRLSRIIDRARRLTEDRDRAELSAHQTTELKSLELRRHCVSVAIAAGTVAALFLCMVIIVLFVDVILNARLHWLVGGLFVGSTIALVIGWAYFLREVYLATHLTRIYLPDNL